jgi:serine/threonine-protein kinase
VSETTGRLTAALADRYRIERELGQGGMATVYLAHDVRHDRPVALKVLRPELAAVIGAKRFLAEIRTTANLQHPHILPLHDSGEVEGTVFYVMPYVEGESLRDRLAREKQLPIADAVSIAAEVADALGYAHEHGVIHRDIKPENILLQRGHAVVADFGIALAASRAEGGTRLTETGMSLGTPHYMSPEQAMGERVLTGRSDVYALGCVLYEMLGGEPPFTGPTAQAVVAKVMTAEPVPVAELRKTVPANVAAAVHTALQKLPADRFATATEFAAALQRPDAGTHGSAEARRRRAPAARPWTMVAGGLGVAVVGFWLGTSLSHRGAPPIAGFGRATKVTFDPGLEIQPAIAPDGRSVAYAAGTSVALRIFVRQVAGGRAIPLTNDSSEVESDPSWSPDGTRILFLARGGVFSSPSSGGEARPEIPAPAQGRIASAAWAPDGHTIAYAVDDSLFLWADQHQERRVATIHDPSLCVWSPNSRRIACASGNSPYLAPGILFSNLSPNRIVVARIQDGAVATVTDSSSLNQSPVWSRDGRWLYFVSDRDGPRDIYVVRMASNGQAAGRPLRLTTGLGAQSFSLSADGSRLAYSVLAASSNVWSLPLPTHPPVSAQAATMVTSGSQVVEALTVSLDDKWLVYHSDLTGKGQVYRLALPHGSPERLTSDAYDDYQPDLSPDDREVAFHSLRTGSRDIFVQPLDGGPLQQVTSSPHEEAVPRWSPDGTALAFYDNRDQGGIWIVRRRPDRTWATPIKRVALGARPTWSPDGRWLAYSSTLSGGTVSIVPVDSGPARILVDPARAGVPRGEAAIWSADGKTVYFKSHDARGDASIWAVPAAGGTPRLLVRFDDPSRPSYRPDFAVRGGRIFFMFEDRQSDVYVMEVVKR